MKILYIELKALIVSVRLSTYCVDYLGGFIFHAKINAKQV